MARYVIDKYGDDERFRAYTSVTRDNLAYIYSLTGRFAEALRIWEDLIDKYSDIVESPDYGNWFGVQCLFSIFGALDRVCGDNFSDDRYIKAVSFLERISSLRNDEVGLFADMLLYEYYFKSGKKDFADKKFKQVETRIANYSSQSIHNFWQGMQVKVKRLESWKKAKGG
jgi:tetratricopeptide (TPR) repeat protein